MTEAVGAPEPGRRPAGVTSQVTAGRLIVSLVLVSLILAAVHFATAGEQGASSAVSVAPASGSAPRIGSPAPDFEALDLRGKVVRLGDYRGRPVWINFWASWCPPCRAEMPDVESAYQEKRGDGVVLLAVDIEEDAAAVRRYVEASGVTYSVLLDADGSVAARYRVSGLPTHIFVDREGIIRGIQVGGLSRIAILRRLASILPGG